MSERPFEPGGPASVPPVDIVPERAPTEPGWAAGGSQPVTGGERYPTSGTTASSGDGGTATVATDQAKQVASTAAGNAREVAGEAKVQARQVAGEAKDQALGALYSAQDELRGHAGQQTERAAQGLRGLADQLQALVEGRTDEAGAAGQYARQAGDRVSQFAERLEQGGFDGVVDDVRTFARRRPGLFLVGAAAAGFAAGRMLRAARAGDPDGDGSSDDLPAFAAAAGRTGLNGPGSVDTAYPASYPYAPSTAEPATVPSQFAPTADYPPATGGGYPGGRDPGVG